MILCKIKWYNTYDRKDITDQILFSCDNLATVMNNLIKTYKESIKSVEIQVFQKDHILLTNETYNIIKNWDDNMLASVL